MKMKIYLVSNDAGEGTAVVAKTMLEAIDAWRAENYDSKITPEEQEWPVSCALVYEGLILGIDE